jgi:TPR repeat protein
MPRLPLAALALVVLVLPACLSGPEKAESYYRRGAAYYHGEGTGQNYAEALRWFRKAAEQNHPQALSWIGVIYYEGRGVPQDHAEAARWFTRAAELGVPAAQNNLGFMYLMGEGVTQDYVQAYVWLSLAATFGVEQSYSLRRQAAARMSPDQLEEARRQVELRTGKARTAPEGKESP